MADRIHQRAGSGARFILLFTSFISGFCILALELLAFRIFAPRFGYSTYVSASIVGSVLFVMSIGYVIGGAIADRRPRPSVLYKIILAAGVYLFPMLLVYNKIMVASFRHMGTIAGAICAALAILAIPMILLSMVGPFVIKLLAGQSDVGKTSGHVFFISTIGSLLGTFITPLVLIYFLGAHMTFIIISAMVLVLGIFGVFLFNFRYIIFSLLFAIIPFSFTKPPENIKYEKESFYNNIQVKEFDRDRYLIRVNWWTSYSVSISERTGFLTDSYYDYFAVMPMLAKGKDILILGMGAGTSVKQFEHFYPDSRIDAVEIDPEIVRIAAGKWFNVRETDRIKIYAMDARPFLSLTNKKYDVIELDMFQGGPNIPFYITTVEFYQMINEHLKPGGVVTMNVLQLGLDKRLVGSVGTTLKQVFTKVYEAQISSNIILIALNEDIPINEINDRFKRGSAAYPELAATAGRLNIAEFTSYPGSQVFTDDKANIEILTFRMTEQGTRQRRETYKRGDS